VLNITPSNRDNGQFGQSDGVAGTFQEQAMTAISIRNLAAPIYRLPAWNELFGEWWHRLRSRYELESLSDRDLADMGMSRLDAFSEIQKPFWQK
jgi:uncharacterized protein YjiS (DUF1127 family)